MSENPSHPYAPKEENSSSTENTISKVFNPNPAVKIYQRIYVILMFLMYAVLFALVIAALFNQETVSRQFAVEPIELIINLLVFGSLSAALAMVFMLGLFWHRGVGGWIYNLILICIGLTSCCTWPMTIPLLLFWIKHKDDIQCG